MSQPEPLRFPCTDQELFDWVLARLVEQGRPSMDAIRCLYRGPDGCKCAAGWLIPDDQYDPTLEGQSVTSIKVTRPSACPWAAAQQPIVVELQMAHDQATRWRRPGTPFVSTLWEVVQQHQALRGSALGGLDLGAFRRAVATRVSP